MTEFTASNGITVGLDEDRVTFSKTRATPPIWFDPDEVAALREFFQHERDELLGRWRSTEDPDVVVYAISNLKIRVIDESGHGNAASFDRDDSDGLGPLSCAAREFFDAHPEPKPWGNAIPGEVWYLTREGINGLQEAGHREGSVVFWPITGQPGYTPEYQASDFIGGRRIWPEEIAS